MWEVVCLARGRIAKEIDGKREEIGLVWDSLGKKKRGANTYMAFIVGLLASLTKLLKNNGCPGVADPAYCEPLPPPTLPGPNIAEPETAALHESDNLPMDSDPWKGPMERTYLLVSASATNYPS